MQTTTIPSQRTLEFGIYRDGDNNLDEAQATTLAQALQVSAKNHTIAFTIEDTTQIGTGKLRTDELSVGEGRLQSGHVDDPHDMASPQNLARFVSHVLDDAERTGAAHTWIELTDHGAGDGGGLEADSTHRVMPMPKIAQAIADGVKMHAHDHPEDAQRGVDGVIANQCLMSSLGFADALSHAGVRYLAASPETMLAPGVPSNVADAIEKHADDPSAMAHAVVNDVMRQKYGAGREAWRPAAAFNVLDLNRTKMRAIEGSVKALNDAIVDEGTSRGVRNVLREDAKAIDGMVRFPESKGMPWHADRPAIALYDTIAHDGRLDPSLRGLASAAERSVANIVLAHKESDDFAPFGDADYSDAVGPTVHIPTTRGQIDAWAPQVSETNNRFYTETDAAGVAAVLA